jgi:hypothetical protein
VTSQAQKIGITVLATAVVTTVFMWIEMHAVSIRTTDDFRTALVFPFVVLVEATVRRPVWLLIAVAASQFPIYGAVLGYAWLRNNLRRIGAGLSLIHIVATLMAEASVLFRYYK